MNPTTNSSLSFRPWAHDAIDTSSLKDVLARVNLERGHFRDITEASLQEEIAAEGGLELSDSEHDDAADDDDADADNALDPTTTTTTTNPSHHSHPPTTREELYKARAEMLQHVQAAEQDILMSLDFVSLLESKYEPGRASSTISPVLKTSVPTGSLGADIWQRMPSAPPAAQTAQEELLAANVRLDGLRRSADDLLAAASRLRDNVRRETRYWAQILAISERGWKVLRLPRQPHLLGVHFGFAGGAPAKGTRDFAALLPAGVEGDLALERGLGTRPVVLRAVVRREGRVVGASVVPRFAGEAETTLEARIRFARDSVFDEELYHEMVREARLLTAMGVVTRGSAIAFQVLSRDDGPELSVSLELVSADENHDLGLGAVLHEMDAVAHAVVLALRLFLGQAHRERMQQKAQLPPPMKEKKDDQLVLRLLRPLVSVLRRIATLAHLNRYLEGLTKLLRQAQVETTCEYAGMGLPSPEAASSLEDLVKVFLGPLSSSAVLTVKPPTGDSFALNFGLETSPGYTFGAAYSLSLPPNRSHRFINPEDLMAGVDGLLASSLASSLGMTLGAEWKFSQRDVTLRKHTTNNQSDQSIKIVIDSGGKTMSAKSATGEVVWSLDDKTEKSFWAAWKSLAE